MVANIRKYIEHPKREVSRKLLKVYNRNKNRIRVINEFLAGNYTSKTINLDWGGKPLRSDLINKLIAVNGYTTYLEIGCHRDQCFGSIKADYKVGVDPASGGTLRMTSDDFFASNSETFDIVFIDGLHIYEQVRRDILNSAKVLNENGTILMHDCLPTCCLAQYRFPAGLDVWNGDTWKAFIEARAMPDLDSATCLIDHGVGVIKKRNNAKPLWFYAPDFANLKYKYLADNYVDLLNTITYEQAVTFASHTTNNVLLDNAPTYRCLTGTTP